MNSEVTHEEMIKSEQIEKLRENERVLLTHLRANTPSGCQRDERILEGHLHVCFLKPCMRHKIEVWYEEELMVLNIGDWTHDHPESLDELTHKIDRIVEEKIVVWKVTRPDDYEYSGHYDLDELREKGLQFLDEPDSEVEPGDRLQKETYTQLMEDRIIE